METSSHRKSPHAVRLSPVMSSSNSRQSIDTHSPVIIPSSTTQYPFPQIDSPQRPGSSGRYGHNRRRGSTASSVASIGGVLDTAAQNRDSITEVGNNGSCNFKRLRVCLNTESCNFKLLRPFSSHLLSAPVFHHIPQAPAHRSSLRPKTSLQSL